MFWNNSVTEHRLGEASDSLMYCRTVPVYKFISVLLVMYCRTVPVYKFICVLLVMYLSDSSCVQVYCVLLVLYLSDSSCVQVYLCVISDVLVEQFLCTSLFVGY